MQHQIKKEKEGDSMFLDKVLILVFICATVFFIIRLGWSAKDLYHEVQENQYREGAEAMARNFSGYALMAGASSQNPPKVTVIRVDSDPINDDLDTSPLCTVEVEMVVPIDRKLDDTVSPACSGCTGVIEMTFSSGDSRVCSLQKGENLRLTIPSVKMHGAGLFGEIKPQELRSWRMITISNSQN